MRVKKMIGRCPHKFEIFLSKNAPKKIAQKLGSQKLHKN
jgi:hypothetical protein